MDRILSLMKIQKFFRKLYDLKKGAILILGINRSLINKRFFIFIKFPFEFSLKLWLDFLDNDLISNFLLTIKIVIGNKKCILPFVS